MNSTHAAHPGEMGHGHKSSFPRLPIVKVMLSRRSAEACFTSLTLDTLGDLGSAINMEFHDTLEVIARRDKVLPLRKLDMILDRLQKVCRKSVDTLASFVKIPADVRATPLRDRRKRKGYDHHHGTAPRCAMPSTVSATYLWLFRGLQ